jgi:hypothetical protein
LCANEDEKGSGRDSVGLAGGGVCDGHSLEPPCALNLLDA